MSLTAMSSLGSSSPAFGSQPVSGPEGEQRFLKLLVTQLNNQDPLNPLQNAELTSQLAQMSTVSGIEKLNDALQALVNQSGAGQVLQAASLIDRAVLTPGSELVAGSGPAAFAVELPSSAESVKVAITDASGKTVRTIDLGSLPQGLHSGTWDGLTDAGQPVPAGVYQMQVAAANGGASVAATSFVYARVASVAQSAAGVTLDLTSGQSVALPDVRMIL